MKTCLIVLIAGLAAGSSLVPTHTQAAVEFSAGLEISSPSDFYEPLASDGSWVEVGSYGRCWRPTRVEADWRPYCNGHWEWTDCGWYWVSDEPWSWACYHYGSWTHDANYGWCWIPGTEWAPAWVTWRESDSYIGWAPCGPGLTVLAPSFFVFVDFHHFREPIHRRNVIINSTTIINRTKVINNFRHETRNFDGVNRRVTINQGPGVDRIQKATGARFTPRPVSEVVRETRVPDNIRRGESRPAERERQANEPSPDRNRVEQPSVREQVPPPVTRPTPTQPKQPAWRPERWPGTTHPRRPQETPDEERNLPPPTGRPEPRVYREVPLPAPERQKEVPPPAAERQKEVPTVPDRSPQEVPRERPLPPGRAPEVAPQPRQPPVHEQPRERDGEKDRDERHP